MYGFDQNTQETTATSALKPGINESVYLQEVSFQSLVEGRSPVLQLTFGNNSGILRSVIWPVDPQAVRDPEGKTHPRDVAALGFVKGTPITRDDAVKMEFDNFNQRLKHIATKFITEQEADIKGNSYEEFCRKYVALLNTDKVKETPVRLKVTLNSKDYSQLPKYPPFIESMDIDRTETKLRITQYDKVEPSAAETVVSDAPTSFNFDDDLI
jgi:hypothetical protein